VPDAQAHIPLRKRAKRWVRFQAVRLLLGLVGALPLRWASAFGAWFGAAAFWLAPGERKKALRSLEQAFPEGTSEAREALARDCFRHLGRCAFELACIEQLDLRIDSWVDWPQADRAVLEAAVARGHGVVFVSGHVGHWELLARRVALAGFRCQTIAKETTDPRLTALVERFRSSAGLKSIWRGQPGAAKQMLRALRQGEILGLLIDQDTRVQSVFVNFFGAPASTPRAAADLALRTGAAVVVGFCQRDAQGRYQMSMRELDLPHADGEAAVVALTAALTARIEEAIRAAPAQWVWMHQRWKTQPPGELRVVE
jgi:KDO2-lipid IV(A) lauroyltransferase